MTYELSPDEKRIVAHLREFGMAAVHLMLMSGIPGGTRTQRVKAEAFADGYAKAVAQIKDAIERGEHRKDEA